PYIVTLVLFSYPIRLLPLYTFFPCTTLFRSAAVLADAGAPYEAAFTRFAHPLGVAYQLRDDLDGMFGDARHIGKSTLSDLREGKDRKSTRLNSSHVSISYAVFCLKKKKLLRS